MEKGLQSEILQKIVLHWNYRGFCELPEELKIFGGHIQEIYLKWNNLSTLPSWMGRLKNLTNLYLQYNRIADLPDALVDMKHLSVLDISHNCLDALPCAIGHLKHLTELLAANNNLKCLPNEISLLQSLERLDLSGNLLHRLQGSVCECVALKELLLDNNQISCLPEKIVYLPSLASLSVSGNHLLYLPMLPFVSSPCLCVDGNPHLNYISFLLGSQITDVIGSHDSVWDLHMNGCFQDFDALENLNHQIVVEQNRETRERDLFLVIPKFLQCILSETCCRTVPTLREIAMRIVYSFGYHHYMEMKTENGLTSVKMKRIAISINPFSMLPIQLQIELKNGPISLCYFQLCQKPLFTSATIWVVPQCCISEQRNDVYTVLSTILFCSISCSSKYTEWEIEKGSINQKLSQKKIQWHVKRV